MTPDPLGSNQGALSRGALFLWHFAHRWGIHYLRGRRDPWYIRLAFMKTDKIFEQASQVLALAGLLVLAGCSAVAPQSEAVEWALTASTSDTTAADASVGNPSSQASEAPAKATKITPSSPWERLAVDVRPGAAQGRWEDYILPGKQATRYTYARKDGRDAIEVVARSSASAKRQKLYIPAEALGSLRFSWNVPALIEKADMARADSDDSPVRIVLIFEGDRSRFSPRNAMLSELARTLTGEELPYATLMYVWCNRRPVGDVIINPRTDRIRKLVIESGGNHLGRWLDYERDVRADYERAFGEPPGALLGVALMTDTDNTRSTAHAWYGSLRLEPVAARTAQPVQASR